MSYKFNFKKTDSRLSYHLLRPLAKFIIKVKYKVNYVGIENLPENGAYILASNHITALDPVMIAAACKRPMHFMAKKELFENKLSGWFLTRLNAFPVDRTKFDEESINYAIEIVKNGDILGIFPEGTRSPDFTPKAGKGGTCYIAKVCKCDVVPVSIYTNDEAKSGTKLTIRYGKPIKYEELKFNPESMKMKDLRHATSLIMERITDLWRLGHGD
ncbi:MAG: 1-acyl-sn-glycerol-3-phosphate acyltransferase [Clostridia bacterium]|nr:1-acyl-sn-glycerol-3-phosphate acyltransferase [Clostridia bacterium]